MKVGTGYRDILRIYIPLMVSAASQVVVGISDIFFLGRLSSLEQAAGNYGYLIFLVMTVIGLGISNGLSIIIARRSGEGKLREIPVILWHGFMIIGIYATVAVIFIIFFLSDFLRLALSDVELQDQVMIYCINRAPALFFSMPAAILTAFFVGTAKPRPISWAVFTGALLNIFLDYAFVFGRFGFPVLRVEGVARATVVAEFVVLMMLLLAVLFNKSRRVLFPKLFQTSQLRILTQIAEISSPLFLQNGLSLFSWLLFFTFIEKAGLEFLKASSIIRAYYGITLIPAIALISTVSSMISNYLGQNPTGNAVFFTRRLMIAGSWFCWPWVLITIFLYREFLSIFSSQSEIVSLAVDSKWSIGLSIFLLPIVFVLFSSITGLGKTKTTLLIEALSLLIYLFFAAWVCHWETPSLAWIWFSEPLYHLLLGVFAWLWHNFYFTSQYKVRFF